MHHKISAASGERFGDVTAYATGAPDNERSSTAETTGTVHILSLSRYQDLDKAGICCYTQPHMKRTALVAVTFLLGCLSTLSAQNASRFDGVVDFSLNVAQIDTLVSNQQENRINPDKFLVLNGAMASIEIIRPGEQDFLAVGELVSGSWVGLEKVSLYRVYVIFSGPEFFKRIPARAPTPVPPGTIQANDQLLVVGKMAGVDDGLDGRKAAYINAVYVRTLP